MVGRAVMAVAAMAAAALAAVAVVPTEAGVVVVMAVEVVAVALDEAGVVLPAGDVELEMCSALHCCRRACRWAYNTAALGIFLGSLVCSNWTGCMTSTLSITRAGTIDDQA